MFAACRVNATGREMAEQAACRLNCRQERDRSEFAAYRRAEFAAYRASAAKNVTGLKCAEFCRVYRILQVVGLQVYRVPCERRWRGNGTTSGLPAELPSVRRWDLGKQRERAGVIRVPVGFSLAEATGIQVTSACAGGICFCGCNQREVTGGAGGRVPVGFGPQRRGDNEARSSECRWDLISTQ